MKHELLSLLAGVKPECDFEASADWIEDGIIDSFDIVLIVNSLEDYFEFIIPGDKIRTENFLNIDTLMNLIVKIKNEN
jgi:acyl carrier protein